MLASLFTLRDVGEISVRNRIVMAPLTRGRADDSSMTPLPIMADYYRQRASAGLIVSEGIAISRQAKGSIGIPGIFDALHVQAWRRIVDGVHAEGGRIVAQLWHVGRVGHASLQPEGRAPVCPSAKFAQINTFTHKGYEPVSEPRQISRQEIPRVIDDFRHAARCAIDAGFDGVEIHGANGYFIDQFLRDSVNDRTDEYGGSVENRCRFALEVVEAVAREVGRAKTGFRMSPVANSNEIGQDSQPEVLFGHLVDKLAALSVAYIHVVEGTPRSARPGVTVVNLPFDYDALLKRFRSAHPAGSWIANNGYHAASAAKKIESGEADLVSFGRPFITNPDFVRRVESGAELAPLATDRLYGGGAEGYIDYPACTA